MIVARSCADAALPLLLDGWTRLVCVIVTTPPFESVDAMMVCEKVGVRLVWLVEVSEVDDEEEDEEQDAERQRQQELEAELTGKPVKRAGDTGTNPQAKAKAEARKKLARQAKEEAEAKERMAGKRSNTAVMRDEVAAMQMPQQWALSDHDAIISAFGGPLLAYMLPFSNSAPRPSLPRP